MAKKIAFGCTLLNRGTNEGGIDGIGHYCQELLHHLEKGTSGFAMQRYSFGEPGGNQEISLYPKYPIHLIRGFLSLQTKSSTPQDAFQSADLIHSTDHLVPTGIKKPLLASIMDVIPLSNPEFIRSNLVLAKASLWKKLSQRADHIITISEFSKQEIAKHMGYPLDQITAIPLGIDQRYFDRIEKNKIDAVKSQYNIDRPFFLFIGSLQPRKNLVRILEAHQNLPGNLSKEFPIVVVGREFWDDGTIMRAIQKGIQDKRCIWLNYVSDFEKRCLLQASIGMIFTSLYEGFGLPILEAFACNTSVITSDCTSMPDVAGGCALLADPFDPESIKNSLLTLLSNQILTQDLKLKGFARAKLFNWAQVAKDTQNVYQLLL